MRVLGYAMMLERIEHLFEINGYNQVPSNLPEFTFFYRGESQGATVIHVIDCRRDIYISEEQYIHLKQKIMEFMRTRGESEVHLLSLVLSNDSERANQFCAGDSFCWTINTAVNRLIIYENQVNDFYGWRGILEEFLQQSAAGVKREAGDDGRKGGFAEPENNGRAIYGNSRYTAYESNDRAAYRGHGTNSGSRTAYKPKAVEAWQRKRIKDWPWVNICLVVVNVIVFLICTFTGDLLYNKGALGVILIMEDQSYYRMLTSMFLHVDTGHLFNNMIVLYYLGQAVEKRLGHIPYAALYFLSGIAGSVLSLGYELLTGEYISSVGASGAVFGVEGALLLLVILYRGEWKSMSVGRVVFAIAFSLYCGFTSTNVNNAAHVGGMLMGFALAAVFCMLRSYIGTGKDGDFNEN